MYCRSWASLGSYWQKARFICGLLWAGLASGKEVATMLDSLTEVRLVAQLEKLQAFLECA